MGSQALEMGVGQGYIVTAWETCWALVFSVGGPIGRAWALNETDLLLNLS